MPPVPRKAALRIEPASSPNDPAGDPRSGAADGLGDEVVLVCMDDESGTVLIQQGWLSVRTIQRDGAGEELRRARPVGSDKEIGEIAGLVPVWIEQAMNMGGHSVHVATGRLEVRRGTVADLMEVYGVPARREAPGYDVDHHTLRTLGKGSGPRIESRRTFQGDDSRRRGGGRKGRGAKRRRGHDSEQS